MANLPAGRLCSRRSSLAGQSVDDTLDHHCSEFGCPVARGAPVAVVLRPGDEEEGFYATPLLLPTEFAVLAHIDDLLGGKMCSHQARRQFHHYHFAESMAEVERLPSRAAGIEVMELNR
eukprot:g19061.t1